MSRLTWHASAPHRAAGIRVVSRGGLPALAEIEIGDPPEVWRRLGFMVAQDGACRVGDVTLRLVGRERGEGILAWGLIADRPLSADLDGIATTTLTRRPRGPAPAHPNGATHVDHVVVATPDLERTLAALRDAGLEVRRTREAGTPERPLRQAFLWAGEVILEVVGRERGNAIEGPASLWGLVAVTPALELLAARADPLVGRVRDAVQDGRRIATVRREAGCSVPLAFMTPHEQDSPQP